MSLDHFYGEDKPGALLIDLSQIALATVAVTYEPGMKFTVPIVRQLVLSTIKHNALKFKSDGYDHVIIAIDNARYGYWRRQEEDYYKRNRAIARDAAKEAESFDWDGYFNALGIVIQELKDNMPWVVVDVRHCEADDCIAVLSSYLSKQGYKVRIISSDGDFTQLHKLEDVDQYSPIQKKFVKVKTGSPQEDCLTKVLKGDRKDCVASIKVRGDFWLNYEEDERTPSTTAAFVTKLVGKSDDEVYEALTEEIMKKAKNKKTGVAECHKLLKLQGVQIEDEDGEILEQYRTDAMAMAKQIADLQFHRFKRNRILIDFDYIRDDIRESIINHYKEYKPAPRGKIYPYLVKNQLTKLLKDLNGF
ncbi:RNAseH [Acinetobacter phage AB-Navy97]|uniref:Ribonuclease n=6 Tax=Lazarusvirus TaxID=2842820 RepID=A0A4Y1NKF7_9CAUD|nr:RNaseH ribonuclease [Acinetobacter phage vB_ApiM_fHyAci03]YP_009881463.1 ribonuclease [Acinetobacter phage KARL-1]YP_009886265.1 ribonuclease [Acinetobacter phage vB_AbaM_Berthold]YP_009886509.1 ribonuclease [Acinetobacter phage vB_AbaM_Apostate]YP_009889868.1 ribonuclease [Acinetobacter phage AM101]QGT54246.1 ribonuclease [Acinetobacter phage Stupor]QKN88175.1 ribonuclease [Acinetobacter phage Abraxas]UJH94779.1 putative ribonuclease H [Acinetobacter phage PhaR5]UNI74672.1 RNAseH [Acine